MRHKPQNRGGIWCLVRRVPKELSHLDPRRFVKVSTGIRVADDPRGVQASRMIDALNERVERDWADMQVGIDPKARRAEERAKVTAALLGLTYAPAPQVAAAPINELMRRMAVLERTRAADDTTVAAAVMGGPEPPKAVLRLSELFEAYKAEQAASLSAMSDEQYKRWAVNKKRAIRIATSLMGDKSVADLTREDALLMRRHFQKRILDGSMAINSANIEMSHFATMLRSVELEQNLGISFDAFTRLAFRGGEREQRPPFASDFIQDKLLADGAMDDLNIEARCIVLVMVETGMRPSEIANLLPIHIFLDEKVPYVDVKPQGRKLKNKPSRRTMPLVGVALKAMQKCPKGFPTYRGRGGQLSRDVNEFLTDAGLLPTPGHSLYGLRHSFEDRLTALDAPDKVIGRLMGHKGYREKYGDGPSLEHLQGWLNRIAFRAPASL